MIHIALCLRTCSRARSSCSRACSRSFISSLVAPGVCGAVCVGTRQNLNQGPLHLPGGSCSLPSSVSLASNTSSSECKIGSPPSCMYTGTRKIQRRPRGMPHLHATYPEGVAVPHPRLAASLRAVARRLDHLVVLLDAHLVGNGFDADEMVLDHGDVVYKRRSHAGTYYPPRAPAALALVSGVLQVLQSVGGRSVIN